MPLRLFVGNLSYHVTEAEVREYFSTVGPLASIHLPTERESGKPRGFAFVEFHDPAQAEEAIRRFNNQPFQGRPLAVNHARTREQGPSHRETASVPTSQARTNWRTDSGEADTRTLQKNGSRRQFGPDADPRGQRKPAKRRPERHGPKKPIPERSGGQFFSADEEGADADALRGEQLTRRQRSAGPEGHD